MRRDHEEEILYAVVANAKQQISIWPVFKELPPGWVETGTRGTRSECLDAIDRRSVEGLGDGPTSQ